MPEMRSRTITWEDPLPFSQAARTHSGMERLQALMEGKVPKPPMAVLVDIELSEVERGRVAFTATPQEFHYNLGGVAHGGFACTLLDSALGLAVTSMLPAGRSCTTLDLHVRFIRPITTASGVLRCEARVLHLGRTIGTAEAEIKDAAGKICAHATTACALLNET